MQTILVVEDEGSIAAMLTLLLELEGYRVEVAGNGQTALERLVSLQPDLILCDVMMPLLGGPEFIAALRELPRFAAVPVIMMSAGLDQVDDMAGLISGFLRKPFQIEALLALVRQLIPPNADDAA